MRSFALLALVVALAQAAPRHDSRPWTSRQSKRDGSVDKRGGSVDKLLIVTDANEGEAYKAHASEFAAASNCAPLRSPRS